MSIATVVTEGYGSFGTVGFIVTTGYSQDANPPPIPPLPPIITPGAIGGDAGPGTGGFGKWFNMAFTTSNNTQRRPARRDSEIGRLLDELVYRDEDAALLAEAEPEDRAEAREIVAEAVSDVEKAGADVRSRREARALVEDSLEAYRVTLNLAHDEAMRLFVKALADEAASRHMRMIRMRIAQDDADLLVFAQAMI